MMNARTAGAWWRRVTCGALLCMSALTVALHASPELYRLAPDSPCRDSGNNAWAATTDYDGIPRPLDGDGDKDARVDMGAFEFVKADADSDGDQLPDGWELMHGLDPTATNGTDGAGGDPDEDGVTNDGEYAGDTNPMDASSLLALVDLSVTSNMLQVSWQGGTAVTQFLDSAPSISGTGLQWTAVYTNLPPMDATNECTVDMGAKRIRFFRVRALR